MEGPLSHHGEDISYHAAYRILRDALTPTPIESTNTEQNSEQKQARADIGKKSLTIAVVSGRLTLQEDMANG